MKLALRNKLLAVGAAGLLLAVVSGGSARAEDTTTTFALTSNGLSISVPATAELSASTLIGVSSLSSQLGTVSVADERGGLLGTWTASVTSTAFTTTAQVSNNSIANGNVTYDSGAATVDGAAVPTGTVGPVTLDASRTAMSALGVTGSATVNWNPTVAVTVPANVVAGTYTGTITHSVA